MRYLFKHFLMRDVVYGMQMHQHLRQMHRKAAEAVETRHTDDLAPHYADLAYHYGRAEDTDKERHYARLAGERAVAEYANAEAVGYFSRVLDLTSEDDLAERYTLTLAREKVYDLMGEREAQAQDLATLEKLIGDDQARAEVALRRANYAEVTGDYPRAIVAAQEAVGLAQSLRDENSQAEGYLVWGRVLRRQGDYEAALTYLQQSLTLVQATGDRQTQADALRYLGVVAYLQGQYAQAIDYYEQGLAIAQEIGHRFGEGQTLNNLGVVAKEQGQYRQAICYYEQSLAIRREIGDRSGEGGTLNNLGIVTYALGQYEQAIHYYEQSLAIKREIGDRRGEGGTLNNLGLVANEQGQYERAARYFEQSLVIFREIGDRAGEGTTLGNLGSVARNRGQYEQASHYCEQSLAICQEIGDRRGESWTLNSLGLVAYALGQSPSPLAAPARASVSCAQRDAIDQQAICYYEQSLAISQEIGDRRNEGFALAGLGDVQTNLSQWTQAEATLQAAITLRQELGHPALLMESLATLARLYLAQAQPEQALVALADVLAYLEEGKNFDGTTYVLRNYLICYQVLRANETVIEGGNPRAVAILRTAYNQLQEKASEFESEADRRVFLENIAAHREIVREWQRINTESD